MDKPRILVDFNLASYDPMPLSTCDVVTLSDGSQLTLREGLQVHLYDLDKDWYDRDDNILGDGIVVLSHRPDRWKWAVKLDERGLYHESDDPEFVLPSLSPAEMREHMYRVIEQSVSHVPDADRWSVRYSVTRWVEELRAIDASEKE